MNFKYLQAVFLILFSINQVKGQQDTIITDDNTLLTGEIKNMEKGVLKMKTSFSKNDFEIEWLKIKLIESHRDFRFVISDGSRYFGYVIKDSASNYLIIHDYDQGGKNVLPEDIVSITHVNRGNVLDVMNLSLDIGYSYTRANHLQQVNGSVKGDYIAKYWGVYVNFNTVQNTQDDVDPIRRTNGGFGLRFFFVKDVFASLNADYNKNSEQKLELRSNYNFTVGRYFIHTNRVFFNSAVGLAANREIYYESANNRKSTEGIISTEFNVFDIGDLNFYSNLVFFPSITDKYRLRTNLDFSLKYDLPRDFYIKLGLDFKYDTKPVEGVSPDDYVFTAGVGWEL